MLTSVSTLPDDFLCKIEFDKPLDYDQKEKKFYCEVELIFNVASLRVNCC